MRKTKVKIPTHLYFDDTPDPPSGLSIERGHIFRSAEEKLCIPADRYLKTEEPEGIANGDTLTEEDYNKFHYESPEVKQLMECEVKMV